METQLNSKHCSVFSLKSLEVLFVFDVINIQMFLWIFYIFYWDNHLGSKALGFV